LTTPQARVLAKAHTAPSEAVAALKRGLGDNLIAVALFGSRARGDANWDSDWDFLVIARELPERVLQRHLWLKAMLPTAWRGQAAILAKTPAEFEASLPGLYLDIALDGILLYDTDRFLATRLAHLRRLIKMHGLRREANRRDLIWRWERFPGFDWSLEWEKA
jgi:predicted nucleotidyltransferase